MQLLLLSTPTTVHTAYSNIRGWLCSELSELKKSQQHNTQLRQPRILIPFGHEHNSTLGKSGGDVIS